jgi:hypothetical protein
LIFLLENLKNLLARSFLIYTKKSPDSKNRCTSIFPLV